MVSEGRLRVARKLRLLLALDADIERFLFEKFPFVLDRSYI